MEPTDAELVTRTLNGENTAFEYLVRRYQGAVYGLAYHLLQDFTDAEDLSQEAFFKAYCKLPQLKDRSKFASWLKRVTWNLCQMELRRKGRTEYLDAPGNEIILQTLVDDSPSPQAHLEHKELQEKVAEALQSLSEKNRLVTVLFYFDGLSYRQISDFLEIPVTTVESRLHKARKQLKKEMLEMTQEILGQKHFEAELLKDVTGYLKIIPCPGNEPGYGFLRPSVECHSRADDIYIPPSTIRRFGLQEGDFISGKARPPKTVGEKRENYHAMLKIETLNRKPLESPTSPVSGYLKIASIKGIPHGFLLPSVDAQFLSASGPETDKTYVHPYHIQHLQLKEDYFIKGRARPPRADISEQHQVLIQVDSVNDDAEKDVTGYLKIIPCPGHEPGYGFLKSSVDDAPCADDIYIPPSMIKRYSLQEGNFISGIARPPKTWGEKQEHYYALLKIKNVNGGSIERNA